MKQRIKENIIQNIGLGDVNPLICGYEYCLPGHSYGPHTRSYYLLHYVANGCGVLHNDRGSYNITAGEIFVIRPQEKTTYTASAKTPWEYYWLGFESSINLNGILQNDVLKAPACAPAFFAAAQTNLTQGAEFFICAKIYEILGHIQSLQSSCAHQNIVKQHVHAAQNYIDANYQKEISISALAENLGLNRSYFWKSFKAQTGKSPQQYLVDLRMEKAVEIMQQGLSPGEAAAEVGYPDIFSFSRMFKRKFGLSPSAYINLENKK